MFCTIELNGADQYPLENEIKNRTKKTFHNKKILINNGE